MRLKRSKCSVCGSTRVARILYGLPDFTIEELQRDVDSERIILGGCIVFEDSPAWPCWNCGAEWGVIRREETPS
jgi:hypothetical protein